MGELFLLFHKILIKYFNETIIYCFDFKQRNVLILKILFPFEIIFENFNFDGMV